MAERLPQYIDGAFVQSTTTEWLPVRNPATQEILCEMPVATDEEMSQAVASAKVAFASWKEVAVPERSRLMLRYQALLKERHDEIATVLALETGKTFEDA